MKKSQKEIVLEVLKRNRKWVPSYDLVKVETPWGWLGIQSDRRAREMAQEGVIERRLAKEIKGSKVDNQIVCYRVGKK